MIDLPAIDAAGLASSEILKQARAATSSTPIEDRIVRLVISNVAAEAYRSLDSSAIRRLGSSALHFELRVDAAEADKAAVSTSDMQIGLLADEFRKYVATLDLPDPKKSRLMEMGIPYLEKVQE